MVGLESILDIYDTKLQTMKVTIDLTAKSDADAQLDRGRAILWEAQVVQTLRTCPADSLRAKVMELNEQAVVRKVKSSLILPQIWGKVQAIVTG